MERAVSTYVDRRASIAFARRGWLRLGGALEGPQMAARNVRFAGMALMLVVVGGGALAQDAAMPTFTGNGSITQALNTDTGAIFDLGSGIVMTFPKGLPVGRSRLVTLKKSAKKIAPAQVQKGFSPLGTALEFSTPISAGGGSPMEVAISVKNDPRKVGQKLVLAMEIGTLCNDTNKSTKLKNGLCSGWELVDADYDGTGRRLVAKLQSTGGLRMTFGLVPQ
jgi:hypothetical protein